jgi:hypothetical protein
MVLVVVSLIFGVILQSVRPVQSQPQLTVEGVLNTAFVSTIKNIVVSNPAAGADWVQTVPSGKRWRVMTGNFQLATSATVANRFPAIVFDDGVNQFYATAWDNAIVASTPVAKISLGPQRYVAVNDGNAQTIAYIGNLILSPGMRVRSNTTSIQVGDQWSNIFLLVEEWTR